MDSFSDSLSAIRELKELGIVTDYAIAGAMAAVFWSEPVATFDLDVLVLLPRTDKSLISLEPICTWAADRGYESQAEHIQIGGCRFSFFRRIAHWPRRPFEKPERSTIAALQSGS